MPISEFLQSMEDDFGHDTAVRAGGVFCCPLCEEGKECSTLSVYRHDGHTVLRLFSTESHKQMLFSLNAELAEGVADTIKWMAEEPPGEKDMRIQYRSVWSLLAFDIRSRSVSLSTREIGRLSDAVMRGRVGREGDDFAVPAYILSQGTTPRLYAGRTPERHAWAFQNILESLGVKVNGDWGSAVEQVAEELREALGSLASTLEGVGLGSYAGALEHGEHNRKFRDAVLLNIAVAGTDSELYAAWTLKRLVKAYHDAWGL